MRRKSTKIFAGAVPIGGDAPFSVQSMTNTDTRNVEATCAQIQRLEEAGCDIVRLAVPDMAAAKAIAEIKKQVRLPVVADIHFDYRIALEAAKNGVDKLRINPGNIGGADRVRAVADACRERKIPIRIGVNGGSLEKSVVERYGHTPEAMAESAMSHVKLLEDVDFRDICISIKSSDVRTTVEAYSILAERCEYPLHLGVTETGTEYMGIVKSSAGIGSLLLRGIGDTLRVSLTADPAAEVKAGIAILKSLGLRGGPRLVSCPTCGRTRVDLIPIATQVEKRLEGIDRDITVAVMGCAVNGPGEAKNADYGIACGEGEGLLFRKGEVVGKCPEDRLCDALFDMISKD